MLRRLRDDDDEWIGTMARRLQPSGDDLTDTGRATGDIATMLQLRRVPLFQQLSPEDLQRIASVATERWFDEGEPLVREGEPGDELFVIVEGRVRVVHRATDGTERDAPDVRRGRPHRRARGPARAARASRRSSPTAAVSGRWSSAATA